MDQNQVSYWYEFTTFVRRRPNSSLFGVSIIGGENSPISVSRTDPQNGCRDIRPFDVILSINGIDVTQTNENIHDLAVDLFRSTPQNAAVQLRVRRFLPVKLVEFVQIKFLPHDQQLGITVTTTVDGQGFRICSITPGGTVYRTHRLNAGDHILEVHCSADDKTKVDLRWMNHEEGVETIRRAYQNKEITFLIKHQHSMVEAA